MGRSTKKGVDYFPHDVTAAGGSTMFTVQQKFGNDGYALWFKLLEHLGTKENLCLDCNNVADWLYFVAKVGVAEEEAVQILDLLSSIGAIDAELWSKKIIWCENFASRLADVYRKRGTERPTRPDFCDRNTTTHVISAPESTQSKVKESKVKNSKNIGAEKGSDKVQFAEFVRMKQDEYDKLVKANGKDATDKMIEVLDNYKGATGKKYNSDYRAILNWVADKVKKEWPRLFLAPEPESGNPFAQYVD